MTRAAPVAYHEGQRMTDDATGQGMPTLADLIGVMAALRTPVTGCPWDLEQNFETIAPYTIEEAYEVADAIARADLADLKDELGDLLLQVVYHARIAEEQGAFAFPDVVEAITTKMIRRHPHVFGDAQARISGMAKGAWDRIKAEERAAKAAERARLGGATPEAASLLDDVPAGMPGLTRAVKLQEKAAKVGFDWPSLAPVLDKMKEELAELEEALKGVSPSGSDTETPSAKVGGSASVPIDGVRPGGSDTAAIEEEFGDLLFVMANVARHLKIDPEAALRRANRKFQRRFRHIEARLAEAGRTPAQSDLAEMDGLWDEAKAAERKGR